MNIDRAPTDPNLYPHHQGCEYIIHGHACSCPRRLVLELITEVLEYRTRGKDLARKAAEDLAYADEETWEYLRVIEPAKLARLRTLLQRPRPTEVDSDST